VATVEATGATAAMADLPLASGAMAAAGAADFFAAAETVSAPCGRKNQAVANAARHNKIKFILRITLKYFYQPENKRLIAAGSQTKLATAFLNRLRVWMIHQSGGSTL
jgi:hypothetical protein